MVPKWYPTAGERKGDVGLTFDLIGGAERDRTADLVNAIHALSQLSYGPDRWDHLKGRRDGSAVPPKRAA